MNRRMPTKRWVQSALVAAFVIAWTPSALAAPKTLVWSGRMTEANGKPIAGPVDVEISFYRGPTAGTPVGTVLRYSQVALQDGVFQLTLAIDGSLFHQIFPDTDTAVWIETRDVTHNKIYPRQLLAMTPLAGKVPVDGTTIYFDADGRLALHPDVPFSASYIQGKVISSNPPSAGQILKFDGSQWVSAADAFADTVTSVTASAPLSLTNGATSSGLAISAASGTTDGYVSSVDWLRFDGKQNALGFTPLKKSGDVMSGTLDMDGHAIKNLASPSAASDAATKDYVDNSTGGRVLGTRLISAGAGLTGGGDLSTDRTLSLAVATGSTLGGLKATSGKLTLDASGAITNIVADSATSATSAASFSGALAGEVSGSQGATVVDQLGGKSAAAVASSVDATEAASSASGNDTIVKRNSSGNFSAGTITANLIGSITGNVSGTAANVTGTVALGNGGTGATTPAGALNNLLPTQAGQSGRVLQTDGTNASWAALNTSNWDAAYTDRLKWDGGATGLNAATGRTSLGLGTSATLDAGTGSNNVLQLDSSGKLPALDGSALTGVVTTTAAVDAAGAVMNSDFSSNGIMLRTGSGSYAILTDSSTNWNTAYTERWQWDGSATNLNATTARTSLGLGTAATLNAGTATNNLVQLDGSGKLPAFDASQLTNIPVPVSSLTCPAGYIQVPADAKFSLSDFCVMKYEAKIDGTTGLAVSTPTGSPWASISWHAAKDACQRVGAHMITEGEWMTIARNIEATAINDIGSSAGSQLATGHSDSSPNNALATTAGAEPSLASCTLTLPLWDAGNSSCGLRGGGSSYAGNDADAGFYGTNNYYSQAYAAGSGNKSQLRTHVLNNGSVLWDFAGNLWEWTQGVCDTSNWPSAAAWVEWTDVSLVNTTTKFAGRLNALSSAYGSGQYYGCIAAGNVMLRGGQWTDGAKSGVFAATLANGPTDAAANVGFRCVVSDSPPSP